MLRSSEESIYNSLQPDVNKLIAQRSYQKGLLTMGAVFEKFLEN